MIRQTVPKNIFCFRSEVCNNFRQYIQLFYSFYFKILLIYWKIEWWSWGGRYRHRDRIFNLAPSDLFPICMPACNNLGWKRSNPGARNAIRVSHMGSRNPVLEPLSAAFQANNQKVATNAEMGFNPKHFNMERGLPKW